MSVTLSRWDKAPFIFVDDDGALSDGVIDALDAAMSYEVPDAEWTDAWKRGEWDGREHLFRESKRGNWYFPAGLLPLAIRILNAAGVDYEIDGIERPGVGDLGFEWDTSDGLGLRDYQHDAVIDAINRGSGTIVLPTGAGKTIIGLRIMAVLDRPTMVCVHLTEVAEQWCERIRDRLGVEPARYFGGDREHGDVMVALYQSMYEDGKVRGDVPMHHDVLILDEAHRVAADTFHRVAMTSNARYRYGLTATYDREDNAELKIEGGTGPVIADLSAERLIDEGFLAEPEWRILEAPAGLGVSGRARQWQKEYAAQVVRNTARNEMLAREIADAPKPCLVTVEQIAHGERLESLIGGGKLVHGDHPDRAERIAAFRDGELDVLISTRGIVGEGFDVPNIRSFVVAGGLKSSTAMIQQVGRALRPGETGEALIIDVNDPGEYTGEHAAQRLRVYRDYYGRFGP